MASQRMVYTSSSLMGAKLNRVAQLGAQFRQAVFELHNECEAYNDANATLEADLGNAPSGTAVNLRGLLNNAQAELFGLTNVQIAQGGQTATRQLLDQAS